MSSLASGTGSGNYPNDRLENIKICIKASIFIILIMGIISLTIYLCQKSDKHKINSSINHETNIK